MIIVNSYSMMTFIMVSVVHLTIVFGLIQD